MSNFITHGIVVIRGRGQLLKMRL